MVNDSTNDLVQVKIVGVGDKGCISLNRLINLGDKVYDYIAINNYADLLSKNAAYKKIIVNETSLTESRNNILEALRFSCVVFLIVNLDEVNESIGLQLLVSCAKELGILMVAVVEISSSESKDIQKNITGNSIAKLKEYVDAVIPICREKLLDGIIINDDKYNKDGCSFENIAVQVIQGIVGIIEEPGLINLDYEDLRSILYKTGIAVIGIGNGGGKNAAVTAAVNAVSCQLCSEDIKMARNLLVNIIGNEENISMYEVVEATNIIQKMVANNTNIIWGATVDNDMIDSVKVTIIASGF